VKSRGNAIRRGGRTTRAKAFRGAASSEHGGRWEVSIGAVSRWEMTTMDKRSTSVLPDLIGCPNTSRVQSDRPNAWPVSMANVVARAWGNHMEGSVVRGGIIREAEDPRSPLDSESTRWPAKGSECRLHACAAEVDSKRTTRRGRKTSRQDADTECRPNSGSEEAIEQCRAMDR
jgi:hypothetical protein